MIRTNVYVNLWHVIPLHLASFAVVRGLLWAILGYNDERQMTLICYSYKSIPYQKKFCLVSYQTIPKYDVDKTNDEMLVSILYAVISQRINSFQLLDIVTCYFFSCRMCQERNQKKQKKCFHSLYYQISIVLSRILHVHWIF